MSNPTENDLFISAFEPLATNNRRNTNRRSSILKTIDVNNEERRVSRRVSWAQTYQYKELLADGTTVVMLQELNSHRKSEEVLTSDPLPPNDNNNGDENKELNSEETEDKIKASDFISRLKASTSMNKSFSENPIKRQNTEDMDNTSPVKKQKKVKRNGSKGLTKYLSKHYDNENHEDYETVANTSFNKYGRELVPRTERPDFTQLFADDNDMNLTKMTEKSEESHNETNQMSLTLNLTIHESFAQELVDETRYFTNESVAISDATQAMNITELSMSLPDGQQDSEIECDQKDGGTDFNRSFSVYSVESFRKTERPDTTQLYPNSQNLIDFTEPFKMKEQNMLPIEMSISQDSVLEEVGNCSNEEPKQESVVQYLTKMSLTPEDYNQTNPMSLTLNESLSQSAAQEVINETHYCDDQSLAITDTTKATDSTKEELSLEIESEITSIQEVEECYDEDLKQESVQTSAKAVTPEHNQTDPMSLTLNETPPESAAKEVINETHYFDDQSLAITDTTKATDSTKEELSLEIESGQKESEITSIQEVEECYDEDLKQESVQTSAKAVTPEHNQTNPMSLTLNETPPESPAQEVFNETHDFNNQSIAITDTTKTIDSPKEELNRKPAYYSRRSGNAFNISQTTYTSESFRRTDRQNLTLMFSNLFGLGMAEKLKQKRDEIKAKNSETPQKISSSPKVVSPQVTESPSEAVSPQVTESPSEAVSPQVTESPSEAVSPVEYVPSPKPNIEVEEMEIDDNSESSSEEEKIGNKSNCEDENTSIGSTAESKETQESHSTSIASISENHSSFFDLRTTSPLSVFIIHSSENSSDSHLMSSPTTIDPTLNFTFNASDSSNSFDPFIHTDQSFHTNTSFYDTSSPMQLSFMVRDDTLCILADELERQIDDIVIPTEEQKISITIDDELSDMFSRLRKLDAKQNDFTYEVLSEEKALISYLWGTFALEVRFGGLIDDPNTPFNVRKIVSINMKSLISSEEPIKMRQKDLILSFNDLHKPLITIAHDLIISSFESEKQQIISKYKTSATLHELVSDISVKILSAKKLLTELRAICSSEICRLYPKEDDRYRLVIEILGIRKPIYLVLPINPKSYPDEVIRPEIRIRNEDKHLYCVQQFSAAFLRIESRKFGYLKRLIRGTKKFVRAKKKMIFDKQKNLKQKNEIKSAKLPDSLTKASL